ncbi:flavin-binding monooxygenase-like-domain-containing protein [Plectosphaerella plurivora]|uniref:Flavin-binding monooxygenase-like-domain-containing protein n=1 Tax=Plectosphaerella plurivora TaxID=936078 RepID=A0A9P8VEW0_9PEZI|nr:flavin-binding monooxygenase-like-domain-containing protein [Plectosphaerella plurivora]
MSTIRRTPGKDVCVVGTGMIGVVAIKNLLEQGLNPTAFTKDEYIGGLWKPSSDGAKTTALHQTSLNTSKQAACFTDFPMPDEYGIHPPSSDMGKYIDSYVRHFDLAKHVRLSEPAIRVVRDDKDENWLVTTRKTSTGEETTRRFDRVVLATGMGQVKNEVDIKGAEKFKGDLMHSREFKDPGKYKGKNALVVGIGATGADTLVFLKQAGAGKLYSSHREKYWVLPRVVKGKGFDHTMTRRIGNIIRYIGSCSTSLCSWLMGKGMAAAQAQAFPFLKDHPSMSKDRKDSTITSRVPFFSDYLPCYLRDGDIEDVCGVEEVTGARSVRLTDGRVLDDLDLIVLATGYNHDISLIDGKGDPNDPVFAPDGFKRIEAAPFSKPGKKFPRLYRGFVSEQYPESLAVLGHLIFMKPPFVLYDLTSMALASLWSGAYPLPTASEMKQDIDKHYDFVVSCLQSATMPHWGWRVDCRETYIWLNQAAGTGLIEKVGGWGWEGWKFWWNEGKLYKLLMDGFDTPAAYRLFDIGRGRKAWPGALAQIEKTNKDIEELGKRWEEEQKKAKQT